MFSKPGFEKELIMFIFTMFMSIMKPAALARGVVMNSGSAGSSGIFTDAVRLSETENTACIYSR